MKIIKLFIILLFMSVIACSNINKQIKHSEESQIQKDEKSLEQIELSYKHTIDSLYTELEVKEDLIDSLTFEISKLKDNIVVSDVGFPTKVYFADQEIDLTNERNLVRFKKAYKNELRSAARFIPKSGLYFSIMDSLFANNNIPLDAKYLAVAESKLTYSAHSHAGADGIWQIMPATAREYKLKVNDFIDERRDIYKSTQAACDFLNDMYRYFKRKGSTDWLLSFCAYNAGMGSVNKVLTAQGGTRFEDLIFKTEETNEYVWKAIAIKYIFDNEEKIFSKQFEKDPSLLSTTKVINLQLNGHYKIDSWAKAQGTSIGKVYELNPWIKIYRRARQKYSAVNDVVLPEGQFNILIPHNSISDSLLVAKIEKSFLNKNAGYFTHHIVKKGDNLYDIARKYHTTVNKVMELNGLKSNMIKPGQKLKLYGNVTYSSNKEYIVKKGDSLSSISKKLNIKVSRLIQVNKLKKKSNGVVFIYPGQKLKL